jgi:biopolymer transport protein ExbB
LFVLAALIWVSLTPMPRLRAQEGKAEPKPEAAADAAATPATTPASAPAEGTAPPKPKNYLLWIAESSGIIGFFLLLLSIYFVALIIRLFMELRLSEAVPPVLVEKLEAAIKEKRFQEAYDACRDSDSYLARLVRTGIANLPNGRPEAKEAMSGTTEEIVTGMESKVSYLALIGQLGPMIGLVGTLRGMIMSFQEIALASGAQPKPEKVAEGISTALVITFEGVFLAVFAIFFFAFFRNRIPVLTIEATKVADRTINSLVAAAKQTKPA